MSSTSHKRILLSSRLVLMIVTIIVVGVASGQLPSVVQAVPLIRRPPPTASPHSPDRRVATNSTAGRVRTFLPLPKDTSPSSFDQKKLAYRPSIEILVGHSLKTSNGRQDAERRHQRYPAPGTPGRAGPGTASSESPRRRTDAIFQDILTRTRAAVSAEPRSSWWAVSCISASMPS